MMPAIVGLMPLLDRRLNILTRSGTAANVVPKPATNPRTSERKNLGKSKLAVSLGTKPWQPHSKTTLSSKTPPKSYVWQWIRICSPCPCGEETTGRDFCAELRSRAPSWLLQGHPNARYY